VWSTAAVLLWLELAPIGKQADAYVATSALILAASLIETSYVLAYHDELTGIAGRRAFNEALLSLDQQYAIAIADIDRFKKFNDTYGHDVGDQVLRMVATRISKVGGQGKAFRCGGEEFAIIFRGLSAKDTLEHLDGLRQTIAQSVFQVRGRERRAALRPGESDRRRLTKKKATSLQPSQPPDHLSVTVSIGVAEPSTRYRNPDQVIQAADKPADILAEGQRVPIEDPLHPDQGHEHVAQGQRGQHVFAPGHASIKKGQGRGHHQHQGTAHQHPGSIARVYGGIHPSIPLEFIWRRVIGRGGQGSADPCPLSQALPPNFNNPRTNQGQEGFFPLVLAGIAVRPAFRRVGQDYRMGR
jgi:diguanylate cyclase (GGDEF)-like protein